MSDIVDKAVRALQERLQGHSIPGAVKFVIQDEGTVHIEGDTVTASDAPADTTMTASAETFEGLLDGDINPTSAFMTGKLKVEGDMGLAMKLGSIL